MMMSGKEKAKDIIKRILCQMEYAQISKNNATLYAEDIIQQFKAEGIIIILKKSPPRP